MIDKMITLAVALLMIVMVVAILVDAPDYATGSTEGSTVSTRATDDSTEGDAR